jgi:hypothetical protein
VLSFSAREDEVVPRVAIESLARLRGAAIAGDEPRYADLSRRPLPLRGNATVDGEPATRALSLFDDATHRLLVEREGVSRFELPLERPFERRATPLERVNPIDRVHGQLVHFLESLRSGVPELADPEGFVTER